MSKINIFINTEDLNNPKVEITERKFYWNLQTLKNFRFTANKESKKEVIKKIKSFVKNEVDIVFPAGWLKSNKPEFKPLPKENYSEEILVNDLINQVYN